MHPLIWACVQLWVRGHWGGKGCIRGLDLGMWLVGILKAIIFISSLGGLRCRCFVRLVFSICYFSFLILEVRGVHFNACFDNYNDYEVQQISLVTDNFSRFLLIVWKPQVQYWGSIECSPWQQTLWMLSCCPSLCLCLSKGISDHSPEQAPIEKEANMNTTQANILGQYNKKAR